MRTFLLTWNPDKWEWPQREYLRAVEATQTGKPIGGSRSVGGRKFGIAPGDRAFLLRQHRDGGLIGSGVFTSSPYPAPHWNKSGTLTTYANVRWDQVLLPDDRLRTEVLRRTVRPSAWLNSQRSGIELTVAVSTRLEVEWRKHLTHIRRDPARSPEELGKRGTYREGAVVRVAVDRYERDRRARAVCIGHWGTSCTVCSFDFGQTYGAIGLDFIHVHHLRELSSVRKAHDVDPVTDMRPICPNCHVMLHRELPALTVEQLQKRIRAARRGRRG